MSTYKELEWIISEVTEQSKQIYQDSCDFGVPIYSNNDPIILKVRVIIEQYSGVVSTVRYETGSTQTIKINAIYEFGKNKGRKYTVIFSYVFVKEKYRQNMNGMIGYLDVNIDYD